MIFKSQKNSDAKTGKLVYPLLPLRDIVVFPHMVVPLFVGRQKSINALGSVRSLMSLREVSSKKIRSLPRPLPPRTSMRR